MADEANSPAQPPLERKLSTILSADVAEYSRLMGEDEEQTLNTFRGHKQVFESLVAMHRGRIFNTAGDAILAEFSSAVEAVRCATEIQAALHTRNECVRNGFIGLRAESGSNLVWGSTLRMCGSRWRSEGSSSLLPAPGRK